MMTDKPLTWTQTWGVLYGFTPHEEDTATLEAWLSAQFPDKNGRRGWLPAELTRAIETHAEEHRKKGHRAKGPTGPELKTLIIRARFEAIKAGQPPDQDDGCECWSGCVQLRPHLAETGFTMDQYHEAYKVAVPCECAKGVAATRHAAEWKATPPDLLHRWFIKAKCQQAEMLRMVLEWCAVTYPGKLENFRYAARRVERTLNVTGG